MSVLRNLEAKLSALVEGTFSRAFKSEVRPLEIAHKLAREMDQNKVRSLSRNYAPNEYVVWLSIKDREQFSAYEGELAQELSGYLLEHARAERVDLLTRPSVQFQTDEQLRLGEFGIQARLVRPTDDPDQALSQGDHGHTMVYSAAQLAGDRPERPTAARRRGAKLRFDGDTVNLTARGVVIGRSRECDVVLNDPNISRRHAAIKSTDNDWVIEDLRSTNGVKVNGKRIGRTMRLTDGDRVELGTSLLVFELD